MDHYFDACLHIIRILPLTAHHPMWGFNHHRMLLTQIRHKHNIDDEFVFSVPVWVAYKRKITLDSGIFPQFLRQCRGRFVSADDILNVGICFISEQTRICIK